MQDGLDVVGRGGAGWAGCEQKAGWDGWVGCVGWAAGWDGWILQNELAELAGLCRMGWLSWMGCAERAG